MVPLLVVPSLYDDFDDGMTFNNPVAVLMSVWGFASKMATVLLNQTHDLQCEAKHQCSTLTVWLRENWPMGDSLSHLSPSLLSNQSTNTNDPTLLQRDKQPANPSKHEMNLQDHLAARHKHIISALKDRPLSHTWAGLSLCLATGPVHHNQQQQNIAAWLNYQRIYTGLGLCGSHSIIGFCTSSSDIR